MFCSKDTNRQPYGEGAALSEANFEVTGGGSECSQWIQTDPGNSMKKLGAVCRDLELIDSRSSRVRGLSVELAHPKRNVEALQRGSCDLSETHEFFTKY